MRSPSPRPSCAEAVPFKGVPTLAILPVKSFSDAKSRLAAELEPAPRKALAEAMFSDVLTALRRTSAIDGILVVSPDFTAQRIAGGHGADVLEDREPAGQSAAAVLGIVHARELGADRVLLVPGDCPALDPGELDALLARPVPTGPFAVVVPDRHGTGTNALLLSPPEALEPSFGDGSLERHLTRAQERGLAHECLNVPSLALDVDSPEDLAAVRERLAERRGGAAHTRGLLLRLDRSSPVATA